MYQDLYEYIKKPREERRNHLDLNDPCIEIGGDSRIFRGLLAHHLKTTIDNRKAYVCHACHNAKCSNPKHLYWGSPTDNHLDQIENGTAVAVAERTKNKYGEEQYKQMMKEFGKRGGSKGGGNNRLSQEIISSRMKDYFEEFPIRGRIDRLAKKWNCTETHVRRFIKKHTLTFGEQNVKS